MQIFVVKLKFKNLDYVRSNIWAPKKVLVDLGDACSK